MKLPESDAIVCAGAAEEREALLARFAAIPSAQPYHWKLAPRNPIRRLWIVHRNEIVGYFTARGVDYFGGDSVWRDHDGGIVDRHNCRMLRIRDFVKIDPIRHRGFRGCHYFNFNHYCLTQLAKEAVA